LKDFKYEILKTTTGIIVRKLEIKKEVEEKSYIDSLVDNAKNLLE